MCNYIKDIQKIFGQELNNKFKIIENWGIKLGIYNSEKYNNLIELFQKGYQDNFFFVPSVSSYLSEIYGYKTIEEFLKAECGEDEFEKLQDKYGKIDKNSIYVLLNVSNSCCTVYKKYNGNIINTINELFSEDLGYGKFTIPKYQIN